MNNVAQSREGAGILRGLIAGDSSGNQFHDGMRRDRKQRAGWTNGRR